MFMLHKCSKFLQKKLFFLFLAIFSVVMGVSVQLYGVEKEQRVVMNTGVSDAMNTVSYTPSTKMAGYFYNLKENYPTNEYGSCGYVALSMLLGYYDAFCYDNILYEYYTEDESLIGYEVQGNLTNSPGVGAYFGLSDYLTRNNYGLTFSTLSKFVDIYKEKNIQSQLLYRAIINQVLTQFKMEYTYHNRLSTDSNYLKEVMQIYLTSVGFIYDTHYTFKMLNSSNIPKSSVISVLKEAFVNGDPVILTMKNDDGGHAVVAYDYDESTNTIYCHSGQKKENTEPLTCAVTDQFGTINGYLYIKMRGENKVHSNNFYICGEEYCGCSSVVHWE